MRDGDGEGSDVGVRKKQSKDQDKGLAPFATLLTPAQRARFESLALGGFGTEGGDLASQAVLALALAQDIPGGIARVKKVVAHLADGFGNQRRAGGVGLRG